MKAHTSTHKHTRTHFTALFSSQGFALMIEMGLGLQLIYCKSYTFRFWWNMPLGWDFFLKFFFNLFSSIVASLLYLKTSGAIRFVLLHVKWEEIEIISPHSQDLNTENWIKRFVQVDVCWLWRRVELGAVREDREGISCQCWVTFDRGYPT